MEKIMECVANFSEGRDQEKIEQIADAFRNRHGVKLLDYSSDLDHNRTVITAIGEPAALRDAAVDAIGAAVRLIDLRQQHGLHPRIGAADVVPGVSGGTIAFIAGIYDELINSIKSINRESLTMLFTGKFKAFAKKSMHRSCWLSSPALPSAFSLLPNLSHGF